MRAGRDHLNRLHPVCALIYYAVTLGVTMLETYPVYLAAALVGAVVYAAYLRGWRYILGSLKFLIPACIVTVAVNAAFNHRGVTTLFYLPSGNPFTLESLLYGCNFSLMLCCAITEFMSFNVIMTSDKTVCLLGRFMPSVSLLISMALRFVPRFSERIKQTLSCRDASFGGEKKSLSYKIKSGIAAMSSCMSWSFENAVNISDSMRSRGFGAGRSSYSMYRFGRRDAVFCAALILLGVPAIIPGISGALNTEFYPQIVMPELSVSGVSGAVCFFIFCMTPMIFNILEEIKWRISLSKI